MAATDPQIPSLTRQASFHTTRWSVVLAAGDDEAPSEAQHALGELCQTYWYPLYAYVRRRGHSPEDAQDLTQTFFARLLERNTFAAARRERGRFRSFLLTTLKHFLADEWDKARAQKRGAQQIVSLDAQLAESRYATEPVDRETPESLFDRQWALRLLEETVCALQGEYEAAGQGTLFEQLRFALTGDRSAVPYAELAPSLGMSEGAVRAAVHRLRKRYRALLRAAITQTVTCREDVEAELRYLFQALTR